MIYCWGRGSGDFGGGWGWQLLRRIYSCLCDPVAKSIEELGDGGEMLMVNGSRGVLDSARE